MKVCVLVLFLMLPWISRIGDWALSWTAGNERLQIIFVMMLFPLIMNALQYYIIDSFIKGKDIGEGGDTVFTAADDGSDGRPRDSAGAYDAVARDDHEEGTEDVSGKSANKRSTVTSRTTAAAEYDPGTDGDVDSQTAVGSGSGSSTTQTSGRERLPKELLPAE
jgi:hypothetical protein